jgi:predicted nuclease of predicted toxin-antitoxin system
VLLDVCFWAGVGDALEQAGHDVARVVVHGQPHHGIVRLVDMSASQQVAACAGALTQYARELECSAIVTVERHRVRVRPRDA